MFRPLLSAQEDPLAYPEYFERLPFPLLGSGKLDGIRCLPDGALCLSRKLKPLRSYQCHDLFGELEYCDGELLAGDPHIEGIYNVTQSHVMSFNKPADDMRYYVFDNCKHLHWPFEDRFKMAQDYVAKLDRDDVILVEHELVEDLEHLLDFEKRRLEAGDEGIMMRTPGGIYKTGRATWLDEILYKLKRFVEAEGRVKGFEEKMLNINPQERREDGYAKRSKAKEGLVPAGTVGKFLVDYPGNPDYGLDRMDILVGPGSFTDKELQEMWNNPGKYLDGILKFRFQLFGIKDMPRQARASGWRDEMDM